MKFIKNIFIFLAMIAISCTGNFDSKIIKESKIGIENFRQDFESSYKNKIASADSLSSIKLNLLNDNIVKCYSIVSTIEKKIDNSKKDDLNLSDVPSILVKTPDGDLLFVSYRNFFKNAIALSKNSETIKKFEAKELDIFKGQTNPDVEQRFFGIANSTIALTILDGFKQELYLSGLEVLADY